MSSEPPFRCSVCRARQTLRETCRRCQADLRLVVHAHRRAAYVSTQLEKARQSGDRDRETILAAELRWLGQTR